MPTHCALSVAESRVIQVGADGTFVGGDLELSKGDEDEFEVEITGAKPGIWLMSVDSVGVEDGGEDELIRGTSKIVRFVWKSDGTVDYGALPRASAFQRSAAPDSGDDTEWEVMGTFSVDSGTTCLFSKHALDELLSAGQDREAMLESLIDIDEGENVFVPAGVVGKHSPSIGSRPYLMLNSEQSSGTMVAMRLRVAGMRRGELSHCGCLCEEAMNARHVMADRRNRFRKL